MEKEPTLAFIYPTPVYVSRVKDTEQFEKIQNGFQRTYDDLIENQVFSNRFGGNTALLSDISFCENLIEKYNLNEFQIFLYNCVMHYMTQLGFKNGIPEFKIMSSWMALNKPGYFSIQHSHSISDISGVYFFKTNSEDGSFYFDNPVKEQKSGFITHLIDNKVYFKHEVGKIMLFPGWLEHGVEFNTSEEDRVSVSFNINFSRY